VTVDADQRVGPLSLLPAILRERGIEPDPLARASGVDPAKLSDPAARLPYHLCGRLLGAAVAATGCPHFGVLIGRRWGLAGLGLPGQLALAAPTVGDALRGFVRLQHVNSRGGLVFLTERRDEVAVHYAICFKGVEATDQIMAISMTVACNGLRQICGEGWQPNAVEFSFRAPADPRPYLELFRAPVRFNAQQTRLAFPAWWLARPVLGADPARYAQLQGETAGLTRIDTESQLRRLLRQMVEEGAVTGDYAARTLGLHRRALNRQLKRQGTTFRAILDDVRFEVARELLRDSDLAVIEIASLLDYADASALTRAFRRWSGVTPARWRDGSRQLAGLMAPP
jgi:AraC-like DNA-binding protein